MTYEGRPARQSNRVLIALVVVTIALVAVWAVNGGLDEIPAGDQNTASTTN